VAEPRQRPPAPYTVVPTAELMALHEEAGHPVDPDMIIVSGHRSLGEPYETVSFDPKKIVLARLPELNKLVVAYTKALKLANDWHDALNSETGTPHPVSRAFAAELYTALGMSSQGEESPGGQ